MLLLTILLLIMTFSLSPAYAESGADFEVEVSNSPQSVELGEDLEYTVQVTNMGPEASRVIVCNGVVPKGAGIGAEIKSIKATDGYGKTVTPGRVDWYIGNMDAGETVDFNIVVEPIAGGKLVRKAVLVVDEFDPNERNNKDKQVTMVTGADDPIPHYAALDDDDDDRRKVYISHPVLGYEPTILGTNGNDVIYGTEGDDVILTLGGNDIVYGLGGNDIICVTDGINAVYGGRGDDILIGGRGRDALYGGSGDDYLHGLTGKDELYGNEGDDHLDGGPGRDTIDGGDGVDCVTDGTRGPVTNVERHWGGGYTY